MKKIIFAASITVLAIGAVFAQTQAITVEGTLQLQNGQITVSTGNSVYFVPVLTRYIGFIDGLKEGARISVSGYPSGNILQATQVTIAGKSYDFPAPAFNGFAPGYGYGPCCGYGSYSGGMMGGGYGHHRGRW
jgi:hypothetical protein